MHVSASVPIIISPAITIRLTGTRLTRTFHFSTITRRTHTRRLHARRDADLAAPVAAPQQAEGSLESRLQALEQRVKDLENRLGSADR